MRWTSALGLALLAAAAAGCAHGSTGGLAAPPAPALPTGLVPNGTTATPDATSTSLLVIASPLPTTTPEPAKPRVYENRYVIGLGDKRLILTYPVGGTPQLPAGLALGSAVAGSIVTYPDGSRQIADASGTFTPADSTYGLANQTLLQTVAAAQPLVVVADPSGAASPETVHVSAYATAPTAQARLRQLRSVRALRPLDAAGTVTLASITALPDLQYVVGGDLIVFSVEGTDSAGDLADISATTMTWSARAGTIVPIAGTNEAIYLAPDSGSGVTNDRISVQVGVPPSTVAFSATSAVVAIGTASAARVAGRVTLADGRPVASGVALFAQGNLPQGFGPNYWLSQIDASGSYALALPAGARFTPVVGVPAPLAPDGAFDLLVGSLASGGGSFGSGGAGSSSTADLVVPSDALRYAGAVGGAAKALPSIATNIRDAWYATNRDLVRSVTQPDSGLRELLAAPPTTLPSPALPAAVPSGTFAGACYQWISLSGVRSLIVIDASGSNCSVPGTTALVIQANGTNRYAFNAYGLPTAYSLAPPLDPAPSGAALVAAGTWTQAPQTGSGAITADDVSAALALYDPGHQDPSAPLFSERLVYHYQRGANGFGVTTVAHDDLTAADSGTPVSRYAGTLTQLAACATGSSSTCVHETGTLTRSFVTAAGSITHGFTVDRALAGDGSAQLSYVSTASGDASRITMSLPSLAVQAAGGCRVCSGKPGLEFDVDGKTLVGTFTVTSANAVDASQLDPASGAVVNVLSFIL